MSSVVLHYARMFGLAGAFLLADPVLAALTQAQKDWYAARLAENARGRFGGAALTPLFAPSSEPVAETLVAWDRLRRDDYPASFAELWGFLRAHPGWPAESSLRRRAERALSSATPHVERIAYFSRFAPLTAGGRLRYAEALLATGRGDEALRLARQAWASDGLSTASEAELLARFGSMLTPADHHARVDRLLWSGQTGAALRFAPLVPAERSALVNARLALRADAPDAAQRLALVPAAQLADPGLIVDRIGWLRRAYLAREARQLMADAVILPGTPLEASKWLELRLELARSAVSDGQIDIAYQIAANHRTFPLGRPLNSWSDTERDLLTDLEWLAGWTALKRLGQPAKAVHHFQNYRNAAKSPLTQARGDYWAGRAAEAAGDRLAAQRFFASAALHPDYFFGQLALERLGRPITLPQPSPIPVSPVLRAAFDNSELVQAVRILAELGDRPRQTSFLRALVEQANTPEARRLVGDLAPRLGRPEIGVLVGREARNRGELALFDVAYPRLHLAGDLASAWTMIHAITRQESRFDRTAVSPANARGLMQLMPGTAREVAMRMGLPYDFDRLLTDEQYNVTLGSTYFRSLLARWGGSHVLAVASYNAGPGNVNKWLRINGDPRLPGVDVVDWIEKIPFEETRVYVWRVLENAVMYDLLHPERARMPSHNRLSAYLGKSTPG